MAYTTIDKPSDYFNIKLYTGTGSELALTGVGFQPDWVWIKERNGATNQMLTDSVRGATKTLHSQNTDTESTDAQALKSFNSDGFTVGTDGDVNTSSDTYVAWNWKAGTSFTNDASGTGIGSIDSAGSVNTDAGFSVISYTGNGSGGATVAHGLGSTLDCYIVKSRDDGFDFRMYHKGIGATKYLNLNQTDAAGTATNAWNDTAPTSSVFSLGSGSTVNKNTSDFIAYCFAEKQGYSKFGKYTSANSHDSTFVYLGFKPSIIIFKNTSYSGGSDWHILDRTRYTFNSSSEAVLEPNTSDAENYSAFGEVDFLSNGFKIRNNNGISSGGYNHIYMAFAENPFVTSTGVPATAK